MRNLLLCLAALLAAGCAEDSGLPEPTGKGTVRSINAIPESAPVTFRIEERVLGNGLAYKAASDGVRYDDFDYNFNFDAVLKPSEGLERIASVPLKVEAGQDYTFVLTGDVASPDIVTWVTPEREFDEAATVFQVRFGHLAESLGDVDVYLTAEGTAPVAGSAIGTVGYAEILPPVDLTAEKKVLTVTRSGDIADVIHQTTAATYSPGVAYILTLFDGDQADVAPYSVRLMTASANIGSLPDTRYASTLRFFHADASLAAADVYGNEAVTELLVSGHAFGDVTGDIPVAAGEKTITYTPVGNVGAVLFEDEITIGNGTRNNFIATADPTDGDTVAAVYVPDRRAVSTYAKFQLFHAASDQEIPDNGTLEFLRIFVVAAGTPVSGALPRFNISYGQLAPPVLLSAGSYDLYAMKPDSTTPVAGPAPLVVADGDVVESLLLDTTDPNVAEFSIVPAP